MKVNFNLNVPMSKKMEICTTYWGLSGIKLTQPKFTKLFDEKLPLKTLRNELFAEGHVYKPNDYEGLYNVVDILVNKNTAEKADKRTEQEKRTLAKLLS